MCCLSSYVFMLFLEGKDIQGDRWMSLSGTSCFIRMTFWGIPHSNLHQNSLFVNFTAKCFTLCKFHIAYILVMLNVSTFTPEPGVKNCVWFCVCCVYTFQTVCDFVCAVFTLSKLCLYTAHVSLGTAKLCVCKFQIKDSRITRRGKRTRKVRLGFSSLRLNSELRYWLGTPGCIIKIKDNAIFIILKRC